jgi:HEAT repeat protein
LENADHADAGPLLEVARLDPNPLARALSARALGAIANGDVVLALRDLYWRADEGVRQSIVDAWGQREAAAAGGIRELVRVVDTETGAPAIEAGWVLSRVARDGDAGAVGNAAILRGIADGAAHNRVLAILRAPMDDTRVTNALRKAADSPDPSVATAALSRLADVRATRDGALRRLEALSRTGAREALHALARTGNGWAIREVARELSAGSAETRLAAARTLVVAGELERAADLLSDADPHVRMTAACAILNSRED